MRMIVWFVTYPTYVVRVCRGLWLERTIEKSQHGLASIEATVVDVWSAEVFATAAVIVCDPCVLRADVGGEGHILLLHVARVVLMRGMHHPCSMITCMRVKSWGCYSREKETCLIQTN